MKVYGIPFFSYHLPFDFKNCIKIKIFIHSKILNELFSNSDLMLCDFYFLTYLKVEVVNINGQKIII